MRKIGIVFAILLTIFLISGCAAHLSTIGTGRATPGFGGYVTSTHKDLLALPLPKQKILVAVYKFRDQTGQYKPSTIAASFSTAVTQGATTILIKALEDSKWFIPIERENLANLLTERKIIRQTSETYAQVAKSRGETIQPVELPPLMYAGIMLEGGIISYDTNLVTSASGGRFAGIGGSVQHRQDQLSIFLRLVSTLDGRVLKTVNTSKTILSRELDLGVFQFISVKDLLEAEVGFSTNEPAAMCAAEAIEKAVTDLVLEGVLMKLWELKNPKDIDSPAVQKYRKERNGVEVKIQMDDKGEITAEKVPKPSNK